MSRGNLVKRWLSSVSRALHLDRHSVYINARDMQRIYARAK
jgi:hypothetical protein